MNGMTTADFVQQVLYAIYKTRLDVVHDEKLPEAFHANTDFFKEIVMEANLVLQELQAERDWHWLRDRWEMGISRRLPHGQIQEFTLPDDVYKPCQGYNDAVRLRTLPHRHLAVEMPWTPARSGNTKNRAMHNQWSARDVEDQRLRAFLVGREITFTRRFWQGEVGLLIETDVLRLLEPLHICTPRCKQPCPKSYKEPILTEVPDPLWVINRTAAKRAEGDPSVTDRVQSLTEEAQSLMSKMKQHDGAKTIPDFATSSRLGHVQVF